MTALAAETVLGALAAVRDPELDEPVTDLGFVSRVQVDGDAVLVELRLPTYFCAPNFAYLMVADAHDAVAAVPGVGSVAVRLLDHFASDEINAGVSQSRGFAGSFPGLADDEPAGDELADLRLTFRRKAHRACQERVAARLLADGRDPETLARATLGEVPAGEALDGLRRRREELGLPCGDDAPLLLRDDGRPVSAAAVPAHLRFARTTRISIEGNSGLCRGLLGVRYGLGRSVG